VLQYISIELQLWNLFNTSSFFSFPICFHVSSFFFLFFEPRKLLFRKNSSQNFYLEEEKSPVLSIVPASSWWKKQKMRKFKKINFNWKCFWEVLSSLFCFIFLQVKFMKCIFVFTRQFFKLKKAIGLSNNDVIFVLRKDFTTLKFWALVYFSSPEIHFAKFW